MEGTDIISSPAEMLSGVDDNFFGDSEATEAATETPASDGLAEVEPAEGSPEEAVEAEIPEETEPAEHADEAAPEDEVPEAPPKEEKPAEDLPEGVRRGKDRNGKEGLFVSPPRWDVIYGDHKAVQQVSEMLGEKMTPEAIDLRNRAYMGQEKLYADLLSGEPEAQGKLIGHFFDEAQRAQDEGEVPGNPMVPFTQQFYAALKEKSPDAYKALRQQAAEDLLTELYQDAASRQDKNLYLSLGHVANTLNRPFKTEAEMQQFFATKGGPADPVAALKAENESLKSQLSGRSATSQAAQFDTWFNQTKQAVNSSILNDVVAPSVAEAQKQGVWAKRPEAFNRLVVEPLHRAVNETLMKDSRFLERIKLMDGNARRAASAQKRAEIGEQIRQAYANRARLAVEAHQAKTLSDAAALLKSSSDATHQRLEAAQSQRNPRGAASPVPKSLIPNSAPAKPGGFFNAADEARDAARLIGL